MKTLFGCVAKNGKETDGREFEVKTLRELVELLQENKELHINYFEDEKELNLWVKIE